VLLLATPFILVIFIVISLVALEFMVGIAVGFICTLSLFLAFPAYPLSDSTLSTPPDSTSLFPHACRVAIQVSMLHTLL
jgi:hypothetical protein